MGKNKKAAEDPYEEEYGPMQTIYIRESDKNRLNSDQRHGSWYQHCRYSTSPSAEFCIRTSVPESALENGYFHPDRFEPDIVAERCERVSGKELAKAAKNDPDQQRIKKLKNLRSGVQFAYQNVGFGATTYESGDDTVWRKKGKLFTSTYDKFGMEWDGKTWKFDGGLGLVTRIVLLEDVPEGELAD